MRFRAHQWKKRWFRHQSSNCYLEDVGFDKTVLERIHVGKFSYGPLNVRFLGSPAEQLTIGNYCSIGPGVLFILSGGHDYRRCTNYPVVAATNQSNETLSKGPIIVGDDVWVGTNAMILSGVQIGQGAVIGAGAVVAKDVPPYAIVVGNPATVIKYRFSEAVISKMLTVDFSQIDLLACDLKKTTETITDSNVDSVVAELQKHFTSDRVGHRINLGRK